MPVLQLTPASLHLSAPSLQLWSFVPSVIARYEAIPMLYRANKYCRPAYVEIASFLAMTCFFVFYFTLATTRALFHQPMQVHL
jgi:hypothetical protein